jgi:hypothetical protein
VVELDLASTWLTVFGQIMVVRGSPDHRVVEQLRPAARSVELDRGVVDPGVACGHRAWHAATGRGIQPPVRLASQARVTVGD